MASFRKRKYLVIAEFGHKGYLAAIRKKFFEARSLANELILLSECQQWCNNDLLRSKLESQSIKTYQINGNQTYFDKGIWGTYATNYSIMVVKAEIDLAIKKFIRERENSSTIIDINNCDQLNMNFLTEFSIFNLIAN